MSLNTIYFRGSRKKGKGEKENRKGSHQEKKSQKNPAERGQVLKKGEKKELMAPGKFEAPQIRGNAKEKESIKIFENALKNASRKGRDGELGGGSRIVSAEKNCDTNWR